MPSFDEQLRILGQVDAGQERRLHDELQQRLFGRAPTPASVGRYHLGPLVGRGGFGVVHRAHDPELDRTVAIKILHRRTGGPDLSVERVLDEARAVARLAHPNIVPVYDAGRVNGAMFMVMEFVAGRPFTAWAEHRPWQEVVGAAIDIGRALAAAHRAGLVHRDVKPANIVVDADDRARLLDFGLAKATMPSTANEDETARSSADTIVCGTPAYMAPEQHLGGTSDPRVDQFGLSAALYEALYRVRPFDGDTMAELMRAKHRPLRPPRGSVPRRVRRVVLRGLAFEPRDRFATMDEWVAALQRAISNRPRYAQAIALAAVVALGGGGVAHVLSDDGACPNDGARSWATAWNPSDAASVRAALLATELPYAEDTATALEAALEEHAEQWIAAHRLSCARGDGEQVRACLDDQLEGVRTLSTAIRESPTVAAPRVAQTIAELPRPHTCTRGPSEAADAGLVRARTLVYAGRFEVAQAEAERQLVLPMPPTDRARWLLVLGQALYERGRFDDARQRLQAAWTEAERLELDATTTTRIAISLAYLEIAAQRYDAAALCLELAEARLGRLDDPDQLRWGIAFVRGMLASFRGDRVLARTALLQAEAAWTERAGTRFDPGELVIASGLGGVEAMLALDGSARARLTAARARAMEHLGAAHPQVAEIDLNRSAAALLAHDYALAHRTASAAAEQYQRLLGPHAIHTLLAFDHVAAALIGMHRTEGVDALLDNLIAAVDASPFGAVHLPRMIGHRAMLELEQGRSTNALASAEQAVSLARARFEPGHDEILEALHTLGTVQLATGAWTAADTTFELALHESTKDRGSPLASGPTLSAPTLSAPPLSAPPLSGSTLSGSTLSGSTLSGPTRPTSTLSGSTSSGPTLSGPTRPTSTLSGSTSSGPTLSGSTLSGPTLSGPTRPTSTLSGSTSSGSTSSAPAMPGPTMSEPTTSASATTGPASSASATTEPASSASAMTESTMSSATLSATTLSETTTSETTTSEATMSGATASRATVSRATASEATMSGATVSRATVSRATVSRATVSRATVSGVTASGATVSRATVSGATVSGLTMSGLTGAGDVNMPWLLAGRARAMAGAKRSDLAMPWIEAAERAGLRSFGDAPRRMVDLRLELAWALAELDRPAEAAKQCALAAALLVACDPGAPALRCDAIRDADRPPSGPTWQDHAP